MQKKLLFLVLRSSLRGLCMPFCRVLAHTVYTCLFWLFVLAGCTTREPYPGSSQLTYPVFSLRVLVFGGKEVCFLDGGAC